MTTASSAEGTPSYYVQWASGTAIRFRLLSWKEFKYITSRQLPQAERDLWLYRQVVLEGPAAEEVTAGIVMWLGYYLIESSPFKETAEAVRKFRAATQQWFEGSYLEQARALIAGTFRYTFEEIESWDQETFFQRLIAAEMLVGKRMEPVVQNPPGEAPASGEDPAEAALREQAKTYQAQKLALRKMKREEIERRRLPR